MELKFNGLSPKNRGGSKLRKSQFIIFLIIIFSLLYFPLSFPQSNEDCLTCHEDNTLVTEKNGKEISLYVNVKILNKLSAQKIIMCVLPRWI